MMNTENTALQMIAEAARCPDYGPDMVKALMKKLDISLHFSGIFPVTKKPPMQAAGYKLRDTLSRSVYAKASGSSMSS